MGTEKDKNKTPLVSICIPAYNNEDYIQDTMNSVINQSYSNIELIVVDDCSNDATFDVITKLRDYYINALRTEKKIRIYKNEHNLGMAGNWNRCLELCNGKYIKLICADDLLMDNSTEIEVRILENNPEVLCVSSDTRFIGLDGKKRGEYRRYYKTGVMNGREAVIFSLFTRDYLGAPLANMFRKRAYEIIGGFDQYFNYIIDYDFFIRLYLSGKVFIVHSFLNCFRIRRDSNTGNVMGGGKDSIYVNEHEKLLLKYKDTLKLKQWQIVLSLFIRKVMSALGSLYLKINLRE